ncbi:hypothetical protein DL96DRAFT_1615748 [Flagelloscypha sp. PMI_526]|nr:hypothetical protein DL96DRAFT_1615748 [Flagelloscypha sp. PMI_526]
MSKTSHDSFSASKLSKLEISVYASADKVYPHLVPLLKRAPNLRFLTLADSRRRTNINPGDWQVKSMNLVVDFPTLFPNLSLLDLAGDYVSGFLASIDSGRFSFAHLSALQVSHSLMDHIIDLLTCFRRPEGFNTLIIEQPVYWDPADLGDLAAAVTAFFSSSPHPVHFRDLDCSVYYIGIEFTLKSVGFSSAKLSIEH